jgi:hypothetical protein
VLWRTLVLGVDDHTIKAGSRVHIVGHFSQILRLLLVLGHVHSARKQSLRFE